VNHCIYSIANSVSDPVDAQARSEGRVSLGNQK